MFLGGSTTIYTRIKPRLELSSLNLDPKSVEDSTIRIARTLVLGVSFRFRQFWRKFATPLKYIRWSTCSQAYLRIIALACERSKIVRIFLRLLWKHITWKPSFLFLKIIFCVGITWLDIFLVFSHLSGGFPYPTLNDRDLLDFLLDGNRMDKPDNCTDEMCVFTS